MKFNDATEAAYKNGYADGLKATAEKLMLEVRDLRIALKAERGLAEAYKAEIEKLAKEKLGLEYDLQLAKEELLCIIESQQAEIEKLHGELIEERTRRENAEKACHDACQRTADAIKKRLSRGHIHSVLIQDYIDAIGKKLERGEGR